MTSPEQGAQQECSNTLPRPSGKLIVGRSGSLIVGILLITAHCIPFVSVWSQIKAAESETSLIKEVFVNLCLYKLKGDHDE